MYEYVLVDKLKVVATTTAVNWKEAKHQFEGMGDLCGVMYAKVDLEEKVD